ncbi:MAG: diguanylate cyclase [Halofilum sp. (in: g-proteobacteria)]
MGDLVATPLLQGLWHYFPENMFVIRVDEPEDFVIEAANPAQVATLGQECEGQRILDVIPQPTADAVIAHYRQCITHGAPIRYEENVTYVDPCGTEREGHWLTLLVPLCHAHDRITHLFGVSQDVSELRLTRTALERQNEELESHVDERTAELRAANERLSTLNEQLECLASRDPLTGAYNRRHIEELARQQLSRAARQDNRLCLLMIDIDEFKAINDAQGHDGGDHALVQLTRVLSEQLREHDLLSRYGGDEFVVLLPGASRTEAIAVAGRLRRFAEAATGLRLSMGLAESCPSDRVLGDLASRADRLLLKAKRDGRNRLATE